MKFKFFTHLLAVGFGVIGALIFHHYYIRNHEGADANLILVIFYLSCLSLGVIIALFSITTPSNDLSHEFKTVQDALVLKINETIGAYRENLDTSLKEGKEFFLEAGRDYQSHAESYFDRQSAFSGLIKYHVYAAAIRQLHQSHDPEKAEKFVQRELEIIKKIEAGENVYALCGNRAHTEEQAYNTLLGRCKKGQIKPQKSFFRCKDCSYELVVCPNCSGELQRRFKK
jgi:hypothetical protein